MIISKKDFKEIIAIIKHLGGKEKEQASFSMFSSGDGVVHIQCYTPNKRMFYTTTLQDFEYEPFAFTSNPHDYAPFLKGKLKELEFSILTTAEGETLLKGIVDGGGEARIPIQLFEKGNVIQLPETKEISYLYQEQEAERLLLQKESKELSVQLREIPLEETDFQASLFTMEEENEEDNTLQTSHFVDMLKEGVDVLKNNKDPLYNFIKLSPGKVVIATPDIIQEYMADKEFGITVDNQKRDVFLPLEETKLLTKVLKPKEPIFHSLMNTSFLLKNKNHHFYLRLFNIKDYPNLKGLGTKKETLYRFSVDADELNQKLNEVLVTNKNGKQLIKIECELSPNELHIFSRDMEEETFTIPVATKKEDIHNIETHSRTVLDVEDIKRLFKHYSGIVMVEKRILHNLYHVPIKTWRIYTPEKVTSITCTDAQDFDIQERMFREGKRKELSFNNIEGQ